MLRLLDGVSWDGVPLRGDRVAALLAALAAEQAGVGDRRLVEEIWPDAEPVHPAKALQVLVSRARSATAPTAILRTEGGYRLALADEDVDARTQAARLAAARAALASGDAAEAFREATSAAAVEVGVADEGPLGELRSAATVTRTAAREVAALAAARLGRHAEAVDGLAAAHQRRPDDGEMLLALLRAEAATAGPATALARYEAYRADLAERLGVDPEPALQRLHAELLAADDPVRTGLRYDAAGLLGRDQDLARLRSALASSRLVTVLGPGGIGKTSVVHVLARESTCRTCTWSSSSAWVGATTWWSPSARRSAYEDR